jgi:hypothetical protein
MRRREFITLFGGVAVIASAKPGACSTADTTTVGFLADGTPEGFAPRVAAVKTGLADAGFVENPNVAFEFRRARIELRTVGPDSEFGSHLCVAASVWSRRYASVPQPSWQAVQPARNVVNDRTGLEQLCGSEAGPLSHALSDRFQIKLTSVNGHRTDIRA